MTDKGQIRFKNLSFQWQIRDASVMAVTFWPPRMLTVTGFTKGHIISRWLKAFCLIKVFVDCWSVQRLSSVTCWHCNSLYPGRFYIWVSGICLLYRRIPYIKVHYTEVLFHTFYSNFRISFVISRTSLNRGSLNRGSTVQQYTAMITKQVLQLHVQLGVCYKKT